jgi:nicotinamidase-related amidase
MTRDTALVVIDVQVGILESARAYRRDEVLEQISSLLERARASETAIIYVQHDGPEGHEVEVGSRGWHIHPAIAPAPGEPVVRKSACDSFFETTLQRELEERGIRHLVITGAMTEYCVDTTCRRATSLGFDVTLVSDAHTTHDNDRLSAAVIIAHHNALLDGFDAGQHSISVKPAESVDLT